MLDTSKGASELFSNIIVPVWHTFVQPLGRVHARALVSFVQI